VSSLKPPLRLLLSLGEYLSKPPRGYRVRSLVAEVMAKLYERGLVNVRGGNVSARLWMPWGDYQVYITPSGAAKYRLSPEDIAVVSSDGSIVEGKPSIEYRMHLEVYRTLRNAGAVVHAHPPLVLAVAEAYGPHSLLGLIEARLVLPHGVGVVEELEPGSLELARKVAECLKEHEACILQGHGVVAYGSGEPEQALFEALDRVEVLDLAARYSLAHRILRC